MKIPKGMTEQEVVAIIDKVAKGLANKFKFGYHSVEDIRQQARLYACMVMPKYDDSRPLENFLWVHVRNRLCNYKRDNYERRDKPCDKCPLNAYVNKKCTAYQDMEECEFYAKWLLRNSTKKNLCHTMDISNIRDTDEKNLKFNDNPEDKLIRKELEDLIDDEVPVALRQYWIRMKYGVRVPKAMSDKIAEIVEKVKKEYDPED